MKRARILNLSIVCLYLPRHWPCDDDDDDVHDSRLIGSAGSTFVIWFGPTPRLAVADPDLIREIFVSRSDHFDRYEAHPMVRQLEGDGLTNLHGPKWALHRRVLSPAFHPDNLKVIIIK